jgi:hypothetical protein
VDACSIGKARGTKGLALYFKNVFFKLNYYFLKLIFFYVFRYRVNLKNNF